MRMRDIYGAYVAKAERKDRSADEVDELLCWLTGHDTESLHRVVRDETTVRAFFEGAPALNEARKLITGSVCGVKLAEIEDQLMLEIRYADKLIDELAKGKSIDKIKRS